MLGCICHCFKRKILVFSFLLAEIFYSSFKIYFSPLRQLVIQYVRHRSALGAKFHRVDWASIPNLPASPGACARRMSSLKRSIQFRKAVMKLCNMLSERYAKHLEKIQNMSMDNIDSGVLRRSSFKEGLKLNSSNSVEHTEDAGFGKERWDDFDDKDIGSALEGVLRLKQMAKLGASENVESIYEECSNVKYLKSVFFFMNLNCIRNSIFRNLIKC